MRISPQELRARMVDGYLAGYRRLGLNPSVAEVEAQAIADCELVDAARREPAKPDPRPSKPRRDPLAEVQQETGMRLVDSGKARAYKPRALHQNPMLVSERWGAATARIARILQGVGKSSDLVVAAENAELGKLALEYADTFAHYTLRAAPPPKEGKDRNPFRGMSDRDASRAFMRAVEDIADKSTRYLGAWYCK